MAYATVDDLKQALADAMHAGSITLLSPRWDSIAQRAIEDARSDVAGILLARGFGQSQIDSWDRLHSLHLLQALYWAFVRGAGLHNYDDKWVNKYDQRGFLKDPMLSVGPPGALVAEAPVNGAVRVGRLSTANDKYKDDHRW